MGWSFRKSIPIGKLLRINISKRGVGASIGGKGIRLGVGSDGKRRVSVGKGGFRFVKTIGDGNDVGLLAKGCFIAFLLLGGLFAGIVTTATWLYPNGSLTAQSERLEPGESEVKDEPVGNPGQALGVTEIALEAGPNDGKAPTIQIPSIQTAQFPALVPGKFPTPTREWTAKDGRKILPLRCFVWKMAWQGAGMSSVER